jgi:hypothetical protein
MLMQPARSDVGAPPEMNAPGCCGWEVGYGEEIDKVVGVVVVSRADFASVTTAARDSVLSSLGNGVDGVKEVVVMAGGQACQGCGAGPEFGYISRMIRDIVPGPFQHFRPFPSHTSPTISVAHKWIGGHSTRLSHSFQNVISMHVV